MKIFIYILSIYILIINAMPCIDLPEDNSIQKIEIVQSPTDSHQNDLDLCPPTCTCAICVGFTFMTVSLSLTPKAALLANFFPNYNPNFLSEYFQSIWQPPKIS